ncbi:hypothetical protein [Microvirga makkahensis]|uniref:Aminotransferase class I/classII domain-containing protein n=1 Tax=Microvirga makkahensis TaxID=1128670 RepID=A0A7X3MSY4_9HYPH|nr:hypothetical protein [Microvirga makkahensis]MXQ12637.1 hypothetical protein [Microvirga makkahensis]
MPPQPSAARLRERTREGIAGVLSSHGLMHLHCQESMRAGPDRAVAARWPGARLGPVLVDHVVVTGGAQAAFYAIVRVLGGPGGAVCVPGLTYPGLGGYQAVQGAVGPSGHARGRD